MNDLLLRAARGEKTPRTPVWLMRQAGRILPEYRQVRASCKGFKDLVTRPELAAEVTIQPVDLLGVDAAIIFSDILVIPEAMGLPYELIEKQGPYFPKTVEGKSDIDNLHIADPETELGYVIEAIKIVKQELNGRVPLIGFAGAPWSIFCYMIEGKGTKTFSKSRAMLYEQPALSHELLHKITQSTIKYLKAQIAAGAQIVQVFDSWASVLPRHIYQTFALDYIRQICEAITEVPIVVFSKGAYFALNDMRGLPCEVIGMDWNMNIEACRQLFGTKKTLQGNLDPAALYGDFDTVKRETERMLKAFGPGHHIANLGHGVYPDIDPDKVRCFIDTVKSYEF